MTLRDRLKRGLKEAGYPEPRIGRAVPLLTRHCQDILATPGLVSLRVSVRQLPNGTDQIHLVSRLSEKILREDQETDCVWTMHSLIGGFSKTSWLAVDLIIGKAGRNRLSSQIIQRVPKGTGKDRLVASFTSRDLSRRGFREARVRIKSMWVDETDPETIAWWKRFPTPQLAG